MNWKQAIATALPLVGTQLFLLWLKFEARRKPIESPDRAIILTYGLPFWLLGGIFALGFPGFFAFIYYQDAVRGRLVSSGLWQLLLSVASFCFVGGLIIAKAALNRVVVSPSGIAARPLWGNVKTVRWDEIRKIEFVTWASSLLLVTNLGQRIWIDVFMVGFKTFEQTLKTNVPPNVYGPAIDALHRRYGR